MKTIVQIFIKKSVYSIKLGAICVNLYQEIAPSFKKFSVLRSEIPSGICAKLRTVAASNNRVRMP